MKPRSEDVVTVATAIVGLASLAVLLSPEPINPARVYQTGEFDLKPRAARIGGLFAAMLKASQDD